MIELPINAWLLLGLPLLALVYTAMFDSKPEKDYPDVPVYVELVDGALSVFVACSNAVFLWLFIVIWFGVGNLLEWALRR